MTLLILFVTFCFQIAFTVAKVMPIDNPMVTFGVFVCGVCPGGGQSNMFTLLFDGDVSLSITMTFFSTFASIGTLIFFFC